MKFTFPVFFLAALFLFTTITLAYADEEDHVFEEQILPQEAETDAEPAGEDEELVLVVPLQEAPSVIGPEEYVRWVWQEKDAGNVTAALEILDAMKDHYPGGTDEAWWLYGQLLEANSPARDIRRSLEFYRRLIKEYPQSSRAGEANRRIVYLERFYFNIR